MPRYVAFLRGVSPMNAKMPELRACFEAAGFSAVRTVLASGNVVFDARAIAATGLERRAQQAMEEGLGRAFGTLVRPVSLLQQLLVAGVTSLVSLAAAFWVCPPLMLATPLFAVFGVIASRAFGREQSRVGRQYVADMTRLFWHSEDFPRRLRHVRSFQREDAEKHSYGAISAQLGDGYRRQLELVANGRLLVSQNALNVVPLALPPQKQGNP